MKYALAALPLLAACVSDHYECTTDADCDLGVAGRCEIDHLCTAYDPACATTRRYTDHSGELTNACYEPTISYFDPCAPGGSPGSRDDACAEQVCQWLPSCCDTGWSEACAQRAQIECPSVRCDLRFAITASKGSTTNLFVVSNAGGNLAARQPPDRDTLISYLAPAPGTIEPRLAGFTNNGTTLVIGEGASAQSIPLTPTRDYQDIATVDFDRDLRDTVALSWQDTGAGTTGLELIKTDTMTSTTITTDAAFQRMTWGDQDHDAFPDVIAGQGARYTFLGSRDGDDHHRTLLPAGQNSVTAGQAGVPQLRTFDWADVDGDRALDLVVFGNSVMFHRASPLVTDVPTFRLDCDPPYIVAGGNQCANFDQIQWVGATVPNRDGTADLVIGNDLGRNLYRVTVHHTADSDTVDVTPMTFMGPCAGATCQPIRAVIARKVDVDSTLDLIALDADLHVYYTSSTDDPTGTILYSAPMQPFVSGGQYTSVRVSVTGQPLP